MRRTGIGAFGVATAGIGLGLFLAAGVASAEPIDLTGATAETDGDTQLKIKDTVSCNVDRFTFDVVFGDTGRTFDAVDFRGNSYSGTYRQKAPNGRKVVFDLDAASQQTLFLEYEDYMIACSGTCAVTPTVSSLKLRGKVNKDGDRLKIQAHIRGRSLVCSSNSRTALIWDSRGPLTLD